jgi:hypothetical protein
MSVYVLEERQQGGRWKKVPELRRVKAPSQKEALESIIDSMTVVNSINMAFSGKLHQYMSEEEIRRDIPFNKYRFKELKFRVRRLYKKERCKPLLW